MKVGAIALNTFREALRNKVLYSVLFFAIVLTAISAFFGTVSIGRQEQVIKDFGLFSLSFFGSIIAILSGVSLLTKELKQKTVFNILSKPVSRWQFVVGKYLGLAATVSLLTVLMGGALVAFVAFFEKRIDWLLFQGIFLVVLEIWLVSAVTIFFSSMVVTVTLSGIFSLGFYLAGHSVRYFLYFMQEGQVSNSALSATLKILYWIVPDLNIFNVSSDLVYGTAVSVQYLYFAVVYCLSYSTLAIVISALIFSKRELT